MFSNKTSRVAALSFMAWPPTVEAACGLDRFAINDFTVHLERPADETFPNARITGSIQSDCTGASDLTLAIQELASVKGPVGSKSTIVADVPPGGKSFDIPDVPYTMITTGYQVTITRGTVQQLGGRSERAGPQGNVVHEDAVGNLTAAERAGQESLPWQRRTLLLPR